MSDEISVLLNSINESVSMPTAIAVLGEICHLKADGIMKNEGRTRVEEDMAIRWRAIGSDLHAISFRARAWGCES